VVQSGGSVHPAEHVTQHLNMEASKMMINIFVVFFALSGILAWVFALFVIYVIYLEK
jgi:hypothetical protein